MNKVVPPIPRLLCVVFSALAVAASPHCAAAAVLSIDSVTRLSSTSQANLSTGNADWAYWAPTT
ncbi:MAG: hypothetical protein JWN40_3182, partial [Phycisphaerales bacterium]|nr:hypothetical protein [Phycisphaerales bacterium]